MLLAALITTMMIRSGFMAQFNSAPGLSKDTPNPTTKEGAVTSRVSPWLGALLYPLARYVVIPAYFGRIDVIGRENLPDKGPFILAPTHRSRWDALIVPLIAGRYGTGRDLHFMVMSSEVKGIQGWFIRRLGGFPVDIQRPGIGSLRHGVELLEAGEGLVIFPEGGIFRDRAVHSLKPGLARLALQAELNQPGLQVQIVPISLEYDSAYPQWHSKIRVCIGKPLSVDQYATSAAKQAARHLTADLESTLKELAS